MSGAIPPLTQYAFMMWCSVKRTWTTSPLPSCLQLDSHVHYRNVNYTTGIIELLGAIKYFAFTSLNIPLYVREFRIKFVDLNDVSNLLRFFMQLVFFF
jgi:hypothetical protein